MKAHSNADNPDAWECAQAEAVPQSTFFRALSYPCASCKERPYTLPQCVSTQPPYMQCYMKYSSLAGIFSEKKVGFELQFEMLVNTGINN